MILKYLKIFSFILLLGNSSILLANTNIVIKADGQIIKGVLNDSQTAKDFLETLPRTIQMRNWNDREFYGKLNEKLYIGEEYLPTYSNGDITYYPPGNSFAIFYDKENISEQSGLIKIGEITSDLLIFKNLPKSIEFTIEKE